MVTIADLNRDCSLGRVTAIKSRIVSNSNPSSGTKTASMILRNQRAG